MQSSLFTITDPKTKRYLVTCEYHSNGKTGIIECDYDNLVDAVAFLKAVADKNPTLIEQEVIINQTTLDATRISAAFNSGYKDQEENFERSTENVESYFGEFSKYYWEGKSQYVKDFRDSIPG